jgi:hypothetical protein
MKQTQSSILCSSVFRAFKRGGPLHCSPLLLCVFSLASCGGRVDIATEIAGGALHNPVSTPADMAPTVFASADAGAPVNVWRPPGTATAALCRGGWICGTKLGMFTIHPDMSDGHTGGSILTCERSGYPTTSTYSLDVMPCPEEFEEVEDYCGHGFLDQECGIWRSLIDTSSAPAPTHASAVADVPTIVPAVPNGCRYDSVVDSRNGHCVGTWTCDDGRSASLEVWNDASVSCTSQVPGGGVYSAHPYGSILSCPLTAEAAIVYCGPSNAVWVNAASASMPSQRASAGIPAGPAPSEAPASDVTAEPTVAP